MACALPTYDQVINSLKNKKAIYDTSPNASQEDIAARLEHSRNHFRLFDTTVTPGIRGTGDSPQRYGLFNPDGSSSVPDVALRWRTTDRTARMFRKYKTEEEIKAIKENPVNILKTEVGTKVHSLVERITRQYVDNKFNRSFIIESDDIYEAFNREHGVDKPQFVLFANALMDNIDEVRRRQNSIDPKSEAKFFFETFIVDPVRDEGGTIDMVAIYSDGTASIFDYKTLSIGGMYTEGYGTDKKIRSSGFVSAAKQEQWKMQLSSYKKTLMAYYGVKEVRTSRIVPIWVDLKFKHSDPDDITSPMVVTKDLNKLQTGLRMSEYLDDISVEFERTSIGVVDDLIKSLFERIELLNKKRRGKDISEQSAYSEQVDILQMAIKAIVDRRDFMIASVAIADMVNRMTSQFESGNMTLEEVNESVELLRAVSSYYTAVDEMQATLIAQGQEEIYKATQMSLRNVINDVRKVLSTLQEHRTMMVLDSIDDKSNIKIEGDRVLGFEDDFMTQTFMPTSEQENPFVAKAGELFERSYEEVRVQMTDRLDKLDKVDSGIREYAAQNGISVNEVYSRFTNGSGDMNSLLSIDFQQEIKKARNAEDADFFVEHFEIKEKNQRGETYEEWFAKSLEQRKAEIEVSLQWMKVAYSDKVFEDKVNDQLVAWAENNSLKLINGKPLSKKAWLRKNSWLKIKESTIEKYSSEFNDYLNTDDRLRAYYNQIREFVREAQGMLGYDNIKSLNFLPKVRAEILERLNNEGTQFISSSMGTFIESIRMAMGSKSDEDGTGYFDELVMTGDDRAINDRQEIPVLFTNPVRNADGEVDSRLHSKDLTRSMRLFLQMAFTHHQMKSREAHIVAIKDVLSRMEYYKTNEFGQKIFDKMQNVVRKSKSDGASMTERVFNNIVDYHLYGIKTQPFQGNVQLTKTLLTARNYLSLKALGLGFISAGASYVAARTSAYTESAKGLYYSYDHWMKASEHMVKDSKKYHAVSYLMRPEREGVLADLMNAGSLLKDKTYNNKLQQYVNSRLLMRPYSYGDERLDNHITNAMLLNYGIEPETMRVRRLANLPNERSLWDRISYEDGKIKIDGLTDSQVNEVVFNMRRAITQVQRRIKGTVTNSDISYANTDLLLKLMMQFKSWMPGVLSERFGKLKYNKITDAPQWGRYRALWNEAEFKEASNTAFYILGTTANLLLKLGEMLVVNNTISRKIFNTKIKTNEAKSRARYEQYLKIAGDRPMSFEDFMQVKNSQLKAVVNELQVLLIFSALILTMGSDWDDDGEPMYQDNIVLHKIYQILNRVQTELTFSYNPFSYATLINNPIPLSSLAIDGARLLNNTLDETGDVLFGEDNERIAVPFGRNKADDKTEKFHYTLAIIPGAFQLRRLLDVTEVDARATR